LPNESHIKLNQINGKGGQPEEQTLINAGRPDGNQERGRKNVQFSINK